MRLGSWDCDLVSGSLAHEAYGQNSISERHRHRYEYNEHYREKIEASGLKATGVNPKTGLVEVVENPSHPWFVGVQYHPEYKSTVLNPHPLFVDFVKASLKHNHSK
jgi:CTP synthase